MSSWLLAACGSDGPFNSISSPSPPADAMAAGSPVGEVSPAAVVTRASEESLSSMVRISETTFVIRCPVMSWKLDPIPTRRSRPTAARSARRR